MSSCHRAAAPLLLLLFGCGDPGAVASGTVTRDSAGVTIATSPAADHDLPWSLTEELLLGGEVEGPAAFTSAHERTVRTNGVDRIIVLDRDNHQIQVFDDTGGHLMTLGGSGAGPGEFSFPFGLLDAGPDRIGLIDFAKFATLFWSSDGELLEERRLPPEGVGSDQMMLRGDTVVVRFEDRDSVRALSRLVQVVAGDTTELGRVEAPPGRMVELSCVMLEMQPMFSPRLQWASGPEMVAGAITSEYVVNLYRDGRLRRSIRRPIVPKVADAGDALRQYPDGWTLSFGGNRSSCTMEGTEVAEKAGMAANLPVLGGLAFGPGGTVWVSRHTFPGEPGALDVFDAGGAYLGTVRGRGLPMGWLGQDRVLFPVEDPETGVTRIGVYRIARDGAGGAAPT